MADEAFVFVCGAQLSHRLVRKRPFACVQPVYIFLGLELSVGPLHISSHAVTPPQTVSPT